MLLIQKFRSMRKTVARQPLHPHRTGKSLLLKNRSPSRCNIINHKDHFCLLDSMELVPSSERVAKIEQVFFALKIQTASFVGRFFILKTPPLYKRTIFYLLKCFRIRTQHIRQKHKPDMLRLSKSPKRKTSRSYRETSLTNTLLSAI